MRNFSCDWEHAIRNAFLANFPLANFIGCFFHFKQALRKRLLEYCGFNPADIALAMSFGYIDLLCVMPHDEVVKYGIPFVRSLIEEDIDDEDVERWDAFWEYFTRYWVQKVGIAGWSVVDKDSAILDLINRTNNGLESYNFFYGKLFENKPVRYFFIYFYTSDPLPPP